MKAILRCAAFALLAFLQVAAASAQLPSIFVVVDYFPDRGSTPYDVRVRLSSDTDDNVSLLSPDGTLFGPVPGQLYGWRYEFTGLSAVDLNGYVGQWTINDYKPVPVGAPAQKHTFDMSLSDLTAHPSVPHFISPLDGDVLPSIFEVKTSDGGFNLQPAVGTGGLRILDSPPGISMVQYTFGPGESSATIEARASHQINDVRGATRPVEANRGFTVWKVRDTYSAPSFWTVAVPEPSSIALTAIGMLGFAVLRRRK